MRMQPPETIPALRRERRISFALGIGILLAGMLLLLRPIVDPDIWFHLVVGRETFAGGAIPWSEFYVFPLASQAGAFHEWGFGLVYFLAEKFIGPAGISLLNSVVCAGIAAALYVATVTRVGHPHRLGAFTAVVTAMLLMEFRLVYRPETFLYLSIALELAVLEIYLAQRKASILLALPIISLALAQCHPSPLFLLFVLAAYLPHAALIGAGRRPLLHLGLAGLASALAAMINPYGLEQLLLPLQFQASAELLDSLAEFLPAWQTPYRAHAVLATIVASIALAYAIRQRKAADALLLLVFGILAWRYARNIALFALVMALPLASLLARCARGLTRWQRTAAAGVLPGIVFVAAVWPAGLAAWGIGVDRNAIPELAAKRIAAHHPNARVANFFHLGNYLAWASPTTRVLVDGRNFSQNRAVELHDRILRGDPDWEALTRLWNIDAIVTPATLPFSGQFVPLVAQLEEHPGWRLVEREPAALMFVRANAVHSRPLPSTAIWQQAIEEIAVTLRENPAAEGALASLALARTKLGR